MLLAASALMIPAIFAQKPPDPAAKPKLEAPKSDALKNELRSDKDAKPSGISILRIEVTAGDKDVPVDSASIYVRYLEVHKLGRDHMIEMNVKTNKEGVVKVPSVPRGKTLIQVIAPGWKTFGRWYDLDQAEQTIKIKLEKPPRWY
jgi:hypothetical protein